MKTYRVDPKIYEGKEPLATGYKIFNWDWTGRGEYCYGAGEIEGSVHNVDGYLNPCHWGLHFCKNPIDCMKFKAPVQWMRYAAVSAFDEIKDGEDGKTVARTIRIDKILGWDEFVNACRTFQYNGNGINRSDGVSWSYGVSGSYGVSWSHGVNGSEGVNESCGVNRSHGVNGSEGVNESEGVNRSEGVNESEGVNRSEGVNESCGVNRSHGVSGSEGVNLSYSCKNCEGISRCIFCLGIEGGRLKIFNADVSEDRFEEVRIEITKLSRGWNPDFTNAEELRKESDDNRWECTPADRIDGRSEKEAYAAMPEELDRYIRSLPEFDAGVYGEITGR